MIKKIPAYSPCCDAPVLGEAANRRLYCYRCNKTIRSFAGAKRKAALDSIQFVSKRCYVSAMLGGQNIAYARDVPNLVYRDGMYRKTGRSKYTYFIQGSALVQALGLTPCATEAVFRSLAAAERAMRKVLEASP